MPLRYPHRLLVFARPGLEDGARGGIEGLDGAAIAARQDYSAVASDGGPAEGGGGAGDGAEGFERCGAEELQAGPCGDGDVGCRLGE